VLPSEREQAAEVTAIALSAWQTPCHADRAMVGYPMTDGLTTPELVGRQFQLVSHVYRLDPETGMVLAEVPVPGVNLVPVNGITSAPVVDPVTGNLYITYNSEVDVIPPPADTALGSMTMPPVTLFFQAGGLVNSTPAIAPAALGALAGDLYFGDSNGNFYAVAPSGPTLTQGAQLWSVSLGTSQGIWDSPALDVIFPAGSSGPPSGVVYFGTKTGLVEGLDAATGAVVFSHQDPGNEPFNYNSPALDELGNLYFETNSSFQEWF
jgi:outer membrane protein assembly factor BamB